MIGGFLCRHKEELIILGILSVEQVERKVKPLSVNRASGNLWPIRNPLTDKHPDQTRERERNCRIGLDELV